MTIKFSQVVPLLVFIVILSLDTKAQQTAQLPQSTDVLLDVSNYERTKAAIDDAVKVRRYDLLFRAMHNHSDEMQMYCLDGIGKIPRLSQAVLLSKILRDTSLLRRSEFTYVGGAEDQFAQMSLQEKLQEMSYSILQKKRQIIRDYMSTHQAIALANELDNLR